MNIPPLQKSHSPIDLFANDDIEPICRFFAIGKLKSYKIEQGVSVYNSNYFIFASTTQGKYVIKFYAPNMAKTIAAEYAINRILVKYHFLTPQMCLGLKRNPSFSSNGRLATCYDYINGIPASSLIKEYKIFHQINAALLSIKKIISIHKEGITSLKQDRLAIMNSTLARESRILAPYAQKKIIDDSLLNACRTYQQHRSLFIRQWLHSDANVNNFLIYKKSVYTLDLAHIREDYVLTDLACLVTSCLFLGVSFKTIKLIVTDYFHQHGLKPEFSPVLNTLVRTGLIKEYLKIVQRKRSIELISPAADEIRAFISHLSQRQKSILSVLKKMNDTPQLIVYLF